MDTSLPRAQHRALIAHIRERTGIAEVPAAEQIARSVLRALAEQLSAHDAAWLAQSFALEAFPSADAAAPPPAPLPEDLYARVALHEGVALGFAAEHAQSVCRALTETLEPEQLGHLVRRLPSAYAALFDDAQSESRAAPGGTSERVHSGHPTLAEGRPGSRHPLSEAKPERAHSQSLSRSADPHADTKLSSSHGTTQEREAETIAEARPGRKDR